MSVGIVATLKIKEGKGAELEAAFGAMQRAVRENEPGNIYYDLFKENDTTYIVTERYESQEALDVHRKADHIRELSKPVGPLLDGAPSIRTLTFIS